MIKRQLIPVLFLTAFFIISCQTYPDTKGKLIVSNDSLSDSDSIVCVYTKIADSSAGKKYETGYKNPVKIKNASVSILSYDGKGVYCK